MTDLINSMKIILKSLSISQMFLESMCNIPDFSHLEWPDILFRVSWLSFEF